MDIKTRLHIVRIYQTLCIALMIGCMSLLLPASAFAGEAKKQQTIRVAFPIQEGICEYREDGSPCGYNYEYLEKLSEYTGWQLEYVPYEAQEEEQALVDAIGDLQQGKVDLLGPVVKMDDLQEKLEYPEASYGSVYITLCVLSTSDLGNENIFLKNPLHVGMLEKEEERNKEVQEYLDAQKAVYECSYYEDEEALAEALKDEEVDVISGISLSPITGTKIVKCFAPSPYYFVAAKGNTALTGQLDEAIAKLDQVQPNFRSELFEKYFRNADGEFSLTDSQKQFLGSLGTLHILCVDNEVPYVYQKDGQPAGMLVSLIDDFAAKGNIKTEYTFCNSRREAESMLETAAFDMLIGTPFTSSYCVSIGFITSETIMESSFLLAYREMDSGRETVALVKGMESLVDTSGYQEVKLYDNAIQCLRAVENQEADVAIGDRSIMEYYSHDSMLSMSALVGATQNICVGLSKDCDIRLQKLFNDYVCSLSDVEKTNYLDSSSIHTQELSFSLLVQNYPIQTILVVSALSILVAMVCCGAFYVYQMQIKNEELRLANEARSDFLIRMSHDIRTPMNGIVGLLNIADRFADDPDMVRKYHRKIHMASDYLLALINDVLNMSKLESGKVYLVKESVYLRELIDNCRDILEARANEQGITLDTSGLSQFDPPRVFTSPLHLRQIFMNIIGNAIKYNKPDGRVEVSAYILEQTEDTVTCKFVVEDTGIGMSEDFQKHAFEAFSQENQDKHGELKGTGLGLSIVKRLVELMDGSIRIESQLGVGTKFIWMLTFAIDTAYQEQPEETEVAPTKDLQGRKVLAAEDNALNAEILQFMLEDAGMEVVIVENGRRAIEAFENSEEGSFDCILMDVMMPEMNGYEAAKAIRGLERKDARVIPIIALTANAYMEDRQKALDAGMNEHVAKPIDIGKLQQVLQKYL